MCGGVYKYAYIPWLYMLRCVDRFRGEKANFFYHPKSNAEMKKLGKTYYCMVEMDSYLFSLIHKYDWSVSQIHQSFKFIQKTVLRYFGKV